MASIVGTVFGGPVVMGLTPWTKTRVQPNAIAGAWPPLDDAERLERYLEYEALIENRPWDVFIERLALKPGQKEKIVLAAALPELLCNVWADSVWGELPPEVEFTSDRAKAAWDEIDEANEWSEIRAWESVFATAMRGTSAIRLYRSKELGALTGSDVQIEEVPAGIYFPKLRKGSDRLLDFVVLAWEENRPTDDGKDEIWHVRQTHAVDPVTNRYSIAVDERKARTETFRRVSFDQTDLDFLPFVDMHGARWSGRYWGMSELGRAMSLFADVDDTLSNVAEILEYHGKPVLQVPYASMVGGIFEKGADKVIGIRRPEDKDIAKYITYDGQLDSQMASLDKVIELIFLTAEVPRTYFGLSVNQYTLSGTALRLQLQNYLKKAGRWQSRETRRSKTIIDYALRIRGGFGDTEREVKITHGSPLPADEAQDATIESALTTAGLSSKKTAIKRLRRVADVDEELDLIADEKEADVKAAQDAFAATNPPEPAAGTPPEQGGRGGAFRPGRRGPRRPQ